jgi:class 3 adenylate cyclase
MFREQLAGRVSPETLAKLEGAPFGVKLGGQARGVTALAVRVLDEGRLREQLGAGQAVEVANTLLDRAATFLIERGAYLEERSPGGVRCSFGLPLADDGHAASAVRAALALKDELADVARELAAECGERVGWGIGLACGEATVGLFGEGRFRRFGALGPGTDIAWKMAGANVDYGSAILVAASTYTTIGGGGEFRPIDLLPGSGGAPEEIYELLAEGGALGEMGAMRRDAFWRGVVRMRAGDHAAAKQEFLDARTPGAEDRALEHFIAKIAAELARGTGRA